MPQQDPSDLANLVGLRLATLPLQVDQLLHSGLEEEVVAAARPLFETEVSQDVAEVREADVRIRSTPKHLRQELLPLGHEAILPLAALPAPVWKRLPPNCGGIQLYVHSEVSLNAIHHTGKPPIEGTIRHQGEAQRP